MVTAVFRRVEIDGVSAAGRSDVDLPIDRISLVVTRRCEPPARHALDMQRESLGSRVAHPLLPTARHGILDMQRQPPSGKHARCPAGDDVHFVDLQRRSPERAADLTSRTSPHDDDPISLVGGLRHQVLHGQRNWIAAGIDADPADIVVGKKLIGFPRDDIAERRHSGGHGSILNIERARRSGPSARTGRDFRPSTTCSDAPQRPFVGMSGCESPCRCGQHCAHDEGWAVAVIHPNNSEVLMSTPNRIIVGVDGSPPSLAALEWARDEARLSGADLVAVHAWQYPYSRLRPGKNAQRDQMKIDALQELTEAVAAVRTPESGAVDVRAELVEEPPAQALLDASAETGMIVVGTRGRGGLAAMVLGSVSRSVMQHARCPVVVVRQHTAAEQSSTQPDDDHPSGVVAGWSGSPASTAAVDAAAEFAGLHSMELTIVLAWDYLAQPRHEFDPHITREKVERVLDEIVATAIERHPAVKIRGKAELGIPSDVVSVAATCADLLVVGVADEHTGPLAAWSADKVLRHTHCPVMFVPSPIAQHR